MWNKHGLIWTPRTDRYWERTHAQVPVVDTDFKDRWRIYYSSRDDEGKSHISYIDVEKGNPKNVLAVAEEPFLSPNRMLGTFDDCGVMPTSIVSYKNKKYLYYLGWTMKVTVPYHNAIGLVILDGEGEEQNRLPGPVMGTSYKDPGFQGTAFVLYDVWGWKMWYLSSRGWIYDPKTGTPEPIYTIRFAYSQDGVDWEPSNVCLPLEEHEGGISSASVIIGPSNNFYMWYSVRGLLDYRADKSQSYRIGYATSNNARRWCRQDDLAGIERSDLGWDSQMICYPYVIRHEDELFMFYNGNGFGQSGFGYATMDLPWK